MSSESRQAANNHPPNGESKGFTKASGPDGGRLPFEPTSRKKAADKADSSAKSVAAKSSNASKKEPQKKEPQKKGAPQKDAQVKAQTKGPQKPAASAKSRTTASTFAGIPEIVSQRMVRRMALFCGIPTACGMLTFVASYFIVSRNLFDLPTVAVLLISLGFFGIGVMGLSYGALSASWDEDRVGTWFGWSDFRTNFRRTVESWRSARQ